MTAILQATYSKYVMEWKSLSLYSISLDPMRSINNEAALIQIMTLCWRGDKLFSGERKAEVIPECVIFMTHLQDTYQQLCTQAYSFTKYMAKVCFLRLKPMQFSTANVQLPQTMRCWEALIKFYPNYKFVDMLRGIISTGRCYLYVRFICWGHSFSRHILHPVCGNLNRPRWQFGDARQWLITSVARFKQSLMNKQAYLYNWRPRTSLVWGMRWK